MNLGTKIDFFVSRLYYAARQASLHKLDSKQKNPLFVPLYINYYFVLCAQICLKFHFLSQKMRFLITKNLV